MYARVSKVMAQFVLKIEKLSHIMGPTPILEMARAYGIRPRLWLLVSLNIRDHHNGTHECELNNSTHLEHDGYLKDSKLYYYRGAEVSSFLFL